MKKVFLTVFVAFAAMMSASAQYASVPEVFAKNPDQVVPGLKYSQLKKMYNPKDAAKLTESKYLAGRSMLNLIVPGMAQFSMEEPGLGARYLGVELLGLSIMGVVAANAATDKPFLGCQKRDGVWHFGYEGHGDADWIDLYPVCVVTGGVILITNYICSISNAKKVARVKSLYDYDLNKLGRPVSYELTPFVAPVRVGDSFQPAAGITFAMQF